MARRRRLRAACVLVAVLAIASSFRAVEATETAARGGGEDDARDGGDGRPASGEAGMRRTCAGRPAVCGVGTCGVRPGCGLWFA